MKKKIMYLTCALLLAGFISAAQDSNNQTKVKVKIKGLDCNRDVVIISDNLKKQKGIFGSNAVGKVGAVTTMEIHYDPLLITEDSIYAVIERSPDCDKVGVHPFKVKR